MKTITDKLAEALEKSKKRIQEFDRFISLLYGEEKMSGKTLSIIEEALAEYREQEKKPIGETSDGYHTFNELYDHRCLLWINYCLTNPDNVYLVENHFDGWFLLSKETKHGQISYHCPNKFFNLVANIERKHPEFDGHTSNDVIKRLILLSKEKPKTKLVELDENKVLTLLSNKQNYEQIPYDTRVKISKTICQTFGTKRVSVGDIKND